MFKSLRFTLGIVLFSVSLLACTSPEEKAADYIENAGTLFAEGKLAKAEIEYRNALQINQNLPDAWFGLARIHERKQDWRKTYAVLSKIHELAPGHVDGGHESD
jgi:tetratricopeptide (TPR) repeat protein